MFIPNSDNFEGVCRIHGDCWEGLASGPAMHARWGIQADNLPPDHEAWEKEAQLLAFGIINIIMLLKGLLITMLSKKSLRLI